MAGNMDENEIKGVSEAMNELREKGQLSADTLAKLGGNSTAAYKALEGYTKSLLGATGAIGGMAKAVAQGEGTFSSLGSSIVGLTSVVGKLASAIPLVGGAAKALAEGVGEAAKFVLDQLDVMAKNYQTLGDASAGAVDGIDGLYRQFNQLGNYSLPAFTKAVKANMAGLTAFKGTASEGAEALSSIAGVLTKGNIGEEFLRLGMSLDGVGDSATQYAATFGRLGITQGQTTDELTKKTQDYILEVDRIARITGQSREQQQRAQQQTMADARARAVLGEMTRNGQKDAAEQLSILMGSMDDATNAVMRASATGIPLTKEAQQGSVYTRNQIIEVMNAVKSGQIMADEGAARIRKALAGGAEQFGNTVKFTGDKLFSLAVSGEDAYAIEQSVAELRKKKEYAGLSTTELVKKAQELQAKASGALTKDFSKAQMSVATSSKNLQELGFTLAINAVPAVEKFADGLETVTDFINDRFGGLSSKKKKDEEPGFLSRLFGIGDKKLIVGSDDAKANAERYYGKKISDAEYTALIKATHAEASAGKQANQKEQAMIMASILNRARENEKGIVGALTAERQFQSVTGTAYNGHQPSPEFIKGPKEDRLKLIEGATDLLKNVDKNQKNFTAAATSAYKQGTNIGYRNNMLDAGGTIIGGTVFQTSMLSGPSDRRQSDINKIDATASAGKSTQEKAEQNTQAQNDNKTQEQLLSETRYSNDLAERANRLRSKDLKIQQSR